MNAASVATPLLGRPGPGPTPPPRLNRVQRVAISVFCAVHILRGLFFMAYPASGLPFSSFEIPKSGAIYLVSALLGVRDVLLGGLLATADHRAGREVHRALAVNLLSDAADTFILIFSAACAWQRRAPLAEIAAVASTAMLEHLTLWSMSANEASIKTPYQVREQAQEDKKFRLDMWLADMRRTEEFCQPSPVSRSPRVL